MKAAAIPTWLKLMAVAVDSARSSLPNQVADSNGGVHWKKGRAAPTKTVPDEDSSPVMPSTPSDGGPPGGRRIALGVVVAAVSSVTPPLGGLGAWVSAPAGQGWAGPGGGGWGRGGLGLGGGWVLRPCLPFSKQASLLDAS